MEPRIIIDEKKLSAILASLSKICKGKLRFLEDGSQYYINSDRRNLPFCRILSRSPGSNALCTRCNETANARCRESRTFHCYFCHASLVEMMYPVIFEGRYLGNVNIGQFRSRTRTADAAFFDEMSRLTGSSAELLKKAYNSQPFISEEEIRGAELLLKLTAAHLCSSGVFIHDKRDIIDSIERYIHDHLAEPLTLESIARQMYMNPTYLSSLYHKATGRTLFEYIRRVRVTRAVYLFTNSTLSVAEVSRSVGFRDPSYFSKVFRAEHACSPREYRKKLAQGDVIF